MARHDCKGSDSDSACAMLMGIIEIFLGSESEFFLLLASYLVQQYA